MTRKPSRLMWLGLAVVLAGCVPASLHPLCTQQDAVLVPRLAGNYADENGETWTFAQGEGKAYRLTMTQEGELSTWQAYVTNLGTYMFLELSPAPTESDLKIFEKYPLYQPLHLQFLAKLDEDILQLTAMDADWLEVQLEKGLVPVDVETPEDSIFVIFTSPTQKLRPFLERAAADPAAFTDVSVLKRVR